MKFKLAYLALSLASLPIINSCGQSLPAGPQPLPSAPVQSKELFRIDFEDPSQASMYVFEGGRASSSSNPALSGKASLLIDSMNSSSEWNSCFKTAKGLFKPGKEYTVRAKFRILEEGEDSHLLFLIRPFDGQNHFSDLGTFSCNQTNIEQEAVLSFTVPAGMEDYSFQIHARKKAKALVDDIRVFEGSRYAYFPATGSDAPKGALKLATGASEFVVDAPRPGNGVAVSGAEFGMDPAAPDNAKALIKAIAHCKEVSASKLFVPKGVYRFTANETVKFDGLRDFEFDGQGSTFVFFKKYSKLFAIDSCERVVFKNFVVDWDWEKDPLASFVKVENVDPEGEYADFRFIDYESFPRKDVRVALLDLVDPATMSVCCEGSFSIGFEFFKGRSPVPGTQWLSGNLLRVSATPTDFKGFAKRLSPGQLFRMSHCYYEGGAMIMGSNAHLTLQDLNIASCPGMAFVCQGDQHHWQMLRVNTVPPQGVRRAITCTADHVHIGSSKGFFKMEGCEMGLGNDDCLNAHDSSSFGVKSGPCEITVTNKRGSFKPGDLVELRNDDLSPTGFKSRLKAAKDLKSGHPATALYTLEDPVPEQKGSGFVLFNRRYETRNLIIRDCLFFDNRARGLLLLAEDVTVENCRFVRNQMGAIKIETGYTLDSWCEGYGASNILIKGNVFENVNPSGRYPGELRPSIYISSYLKTDPSAIKTSYSILHDILIEGNLFSECQGALVYACSSGNVVVKGNLVANSVPRKLDAQYRGAVGSSYSKGVYVTGNKWLSSPLAPKPGLFVELESSEGAFCWGNELLDEAAFRSLEKGFKGR